MDCTLAAEGLARDARSSSRLVAGEGGGWGKLQIFVSVNMSIKGLSLPYCYQFKISQVFNFAILAREYFAGFYFRDLNTQI